MQPPSTADRMPSLDTLSNMQWYMYHQRNIAFFGAFSSRTLTSKDLVTTTNRLVQLAPQLMLGFESVAADDRSIEQLFASISHLEQVESLEDFPDRWINQSCDINDRPELPMFRIRAAVRSNGADAQGRAGFVLVQVSHALVEGADSALLSRTRSTSRDQSFALPIASGSKGLVENGQLALAAFVGKALGGPAAFGHLLAASLFDLRPGPFGYASFVADRKQLSDIAKQLEVRQRALLFALGLIGLFGRAALGRKKSISTTYSAIDAGGEAKSGGFMHMRMLFAAFPADQDLAHLARKIEAHLAISETRTSGFNDALNASALSAHRWLHRRWPNLYRQRVFNFMPYEAVLGLIPPHRLGGALTSHLLEPVYAGAALEGANACVIVPGRTKTSFNFFAQTANLRHVNEIGVILRQQSTQPA